MPLPRQPTAGGRLGQGGRSGRSPRGPLWPAVVVVRCPQVASPLDLETPLTPATTPPPEGPGTPVTPQVDAESDALVKPEVEPTPVLQAKS